MKLVYYDSEFKQYHNNKYCDIQSEFQQITLECVPKGAFTHSRIAPLTIPDLNPGSSVLLPALSVLSPASPCRPLVGIRRGPWRAAISREN